VIALASIGSLTLAVSATAQVSTKLARKPNQSHLQDFGGVKADPWLAELGQADWIVPDEFIVEFGPEATTSLERTNLAADGRVGIQILDDLCAHHGVKGIRKLFPGVVAPELKEKPLPNLAGYAVLTIDLGTTTLDAAMDDFAADPLVRKVEPIGIHPLYAPPNDPSYPSQWHLSQTSDRDIDAPEGFDIQNGAPSAIVAVLDSGVRYFHKDLGGSAASITNPSASAGNMWINTAEKSGVAGVDDDGNGYVDDWIGYDFVTAEVIPCWTGEDCTGADNDPRDFNGHGTHCAGIVAAINNNGYGTASVAGGFAAGTPTTTGDGVRVMALRIGHSANSGGQQVGVVRMDSAASAFYYAANKGARIASCSWGSSNSGGIAAAVDYFIAAGGIIFAAAGNSNVETPGYIQSRADVYSVAATNQSDQKASFSNYGTWIDISAPGVAIYSSYHVFNDPNNDYTAPLDGTSMATPLVAGLAANVWSQFPTWTAGQVWHRVRTTVDQIDSLNPTFVGKLGVGRVNLNRALTNATNGGWTTPTTSGKILLCFTGTPTVGDAGIVPPEDIAQYDGATAKWSRYFDGSDVGLAGKTIDGMAVLPTGHILLSFTAATTIPGLSGGPSGTSVGAEDIVRFIPTSLGENTAGSWAFYFDGSDVGLTTTDENIDAITILPSGAIGISTTGVPAVTGLTGLADEDILAFTSTSLGSATLGTWSWALDLSDAGYTLTAEDTDGAWVSSSGEWTVSMEGAWAASLASGDGNALIRFAPTATGANTAGTSTVLFTGAQLIIPSTAAVTAVHRIP
jgi:subtilisin family serine protease